MSTSDDDTLILPPKPAPVLSAGYTVEALVIPKVETVMDDALSLLHSQVRSLASKKGKSGEGLSEKEVRGLCGVVDAIAKLAREKRQRQEAEDAEFAALSDEELEAELSSLEEE